jgi:hypothetical protein
MLNSMLLLSVEDLPRSAAANRVLLVASSIAAHIARAEVPAAKDLFLLSAAVVEGAKSHDPQVLELSIDSVTALRQQLPTGDIWEGSRGHLDATIQFAWLLLRERCP